MDCSVGLVIGNDEDWFEVQTITFHTKYNCPIDYLVKNCIPSGNFYQANASSHYYEAMIQYN